MPVVAVSQAASMECRSSASAAAQRTPSPRACSKEACCSSPWLQMILSWPSSRFLTNVSALPRMSFSSAGSSVAAHRAGGGGRGIGLSKGMQRHAHSLVLPAVLAFKAVWGCHVPTHMHPVLQGAFCWPARIIHLLPMQCPLHPQAMHPAACSSFLAHTNLPKVLT